MVVKTLIKQSFVSIKQTFNRFISILVIVLLGVGFFTGIRETSPNMKDSLDAYFKKENVYDISLMSTWGITNDEINEVTPLTNPKFDIHKNNLIIWSSDIKEPIKVDKLAESLDILPTVLNLFGVKFDSRLLMGRDILSNADGLVILNDRSWITEKGFYDASTNKFTKTTDEELSDNYVDKISTIVYNKFVISKNILETNYYKYVFKEEAWI